jgi:hypothetical protein
MGWGWMKRTRSVLYFSALHYSVLHYSVLYCTVLYCTVLYGTVPASILGAESTASLPLVSYAALS